MSGHVKQSLFGLFNIVSGALRGLVDGSGVEIGGVPIVVGMSGVPVILPSNGTIAAGALSGIAALPYTYNAPGCWMYFPTGAALPNGAGLYWVVMSSTTAGTVYSNFQPTSQAFVPYVPQSPVALTVGAAYTQDATAVTLVNVPVAGNLMGPNGVIRVSPTWATANNANTKTMGNAFGGTAYQTSTSTTSVQFVPVQNAIRNRGVSNAQACTASGLAQSGAPVAVLSKDTTVQQLLAFQATLAAGSLATDFIILEGFTVEVLPG